MSFLRLIRLFNLVIITLTMIGIADYLLIMNNFQKVIFNPFHYGLLILSTVLIAAAGNMINDYFDIKADRVIVKNCNLLANQDTLYLSEGNTRTYFENCFINGTTDFIFGAATAYFYKCTIESLVNSYITAASTPQGQAYGFVFVDCKLTAKDKSVDKVFLGRPWRPYAQTVFINTDIGSHIIPEGWNVWIDSRFPDKDKTAYYAEFGSKGSSAKDVSQRVAWSHQLKKEDIRKYDRDLVLNGWNPNK